MRSAKILLLLVLIVALLPYLYTCFYALPFADDFCFGWTASEKISFAQKFLKQYLHWNGRYTSDVMVNFHPLVTGSLLCYQLVSFVLIVAFPCAVLAFIRPWLNNNLASGSIALFISLFYLCYQPNITEGVYWYIGLVNYHLGNLCFILQLTMLSRLLTADKSKIFLLSASLLLLVLSVGFNEVGATLIPLYFLAAIIYVKTNRAAVEINSRTLKILALHFATAFIASLFVIFSPGNFTRENVFPDRFDLIHSVWLGSLQTIRFIGQWSLSVPFMVLTLIVITSADRVKHELIKKTDYRFFLVMILFTVFMGAFLPYMATGILGQHRTINYVFPFFILLWVAAVLSVSEKYQLHQTLKPVINDFRIFVLATVVVFVMFGSGNSRKILADVHSGAFPLYKSEFMQRQANILLQPGLPIVPLNNIPASFQVVDTRSDTTWWVDKCMKRFYTETGVVLK